MKHQIEAALFQVLQDKGWDLTAQHVAAIANVSPIIEKALRAAYVAGWEAPVPTFSENGVTAGIAAMVEEL